jgi:hypothetical protein
LGFSSLRLCAFASLRFFPIGLRKLPATAGRLAARGALLYNRVP